MRHDAGFPQTRQTGGSFPSVISVLQIFSVGMWASARKTEPAGRTAIECRDVLNSVRSRGDDVKSLFAGTARGCHLCPPTLFLRFPSSSMPPGALPARRESVSGQMLLESGTFTPYNYFGGIRKPLTHVTAGFGRIVLLCRDVRTRRVCAGRRPRPIRALKREPDYQPLVPVEQSLRA